MINPEDKSKIDKMSYAEMLTLWRFAHIGHKYFIGGSELNNYFTKVFNDKQSKLKPGEHTKISKEVGWE